MNFVSSRNRVVRREQVVARWRVDAVVTGVHEGRGEIRKCTSFGAASRTIFTISRVVVRHDRIVDDDEALTLDVLAKGV